MRHPELDRFPVDAGEATFLSEEDEMLLANMSSRARRLKEGDTEGLPPKEVERLIDLGEQAAFRLVWAYRPMYRSMARRISSKYDGHNETRVDELMSVAIERGVQLTTSFKPVQGGMRFGRYSGQAVAKVMHGACVRDLTPLKTDVAETQAAWAWQRAKKDMEELLGRPVYDDEVADKVGYTPDQLLVDAPTWKSIHSFDAQEMEDHDPALKSLAATTFYDDAAASEIITALEMVLPPRQLEVAILLLGLHDGRPLMPDEIAGATGRKEGSVKSDVRYVSSSLVHPKNRSILKSFLSGRGL